MSAPLSPNPEWQAKSDAFLAALTALSETHGITIGGCGCCGSPSLTIMREAEKGGRYQVDGEARTSHDGASAYLGDALTWVKSGPDDLIDKGAAPGAKRE